MSRCSFAPYAVLVCMAAAVGFATPALASRSVCVSTAAELRQALADVSDGGPYVDTRTTIQLEAGLYLTGGETFRTQALASTAELDLYGGYQPGCTQLTTAPFLSTTLDAQGSGGVLAIIRPHALVSLKKMQVQNGNAEVGAGIQVNYGVTAQAIVALSWIAVLNNHASADGGGLYLNGWAAPDYGPIQINSTLIAGNSAGGEGGGAYLRIGGGGSLGRLGFITVASNTTGTGTTGGIYASGDAGDYWYRGIVAWGNSPASLYFGRPAMIDWSDIESFAAATLTPTSDHVISLDPHLTDNFRLGTGAPLVRYCPGGAFIPTDLDGNPYPAYGPTAKYPNEIGAYLETIFFDDFE